MLPDLPPSFTGPDAAEDKQARPWWWRLEDGEGAEVQADVDNPRFATKADAESWIGEAWAEVAESGVVAVSLFEAERRVYGPMSLEP